MIDDTTMALLVLHQMVILVVMRRHVATAWPVARPVSRGRTATAGSTVVGASGSTAQLDALDRVLHANAQVIIVMSRRTLPSHIVMSEWELAHLGMLRVLRRGRRLINDAIWLKCTDRVLIRLLGEL